MQLRGVVDLHTVMVVDPAAMLGKPPKARDAAGQPCPISGTHASPLSVLDVFGLDSPLPMEDSPTTFQGLLGLAQSESWTDCHQSATRVQESGRAAQPSSPPARQRSKPRTGGLRPAFSRSSSLNEKKASFPFQKNMWMDSTA